MSRSKIFRLTKANKVSEIVITSRNKQACAAVKPIILTYSLLLKLRLTRGHSKYSMTGLLSQFEQMMIDL